MMDFNMIRKHYAQWLPEKMEMYKATGETRFDPYEMDFITKLTPIENSVWIDIRSEPIQMFPQLPVLNYFLDYANPFKKVAIECDGKHWHDPIKDAIRDNRLIDEGWTIYRIPGHKCNRILESPAEAKYRLQERESYGHDIDDEVNAVARKWFMNTSTGIIRAIAVAHFGAETMFLDQVDETLNEHASRWIDPDSTPTKKPEAKQRRGFD